MRVVVPELRVVFRIMEDVVGRGAPLCVWSSSSDTARGITAFFFFCRIANLKIQLAKLDSEAWPGVLDSERDRLMLINEKEELLKEMRFISPRKWTRGEVERLEMERRRLEEDLQAARDTQSKALTERWVTGHRTELALLDER